jgi:hypothetical protein
MLLNNCGEPVHRQVIDNGLLPILVKIVKKKVTYFSLNLLWQLWNLFSFGTSPIGPNM